MRNFAGKCREAERRNTEDAHPFPVPLHPELAASLSAARAANIIRAEVFTGKVVRGRVQPMNKKAWAAKFKSMQSSRASTNRRKAAMAFERPEPKSPPTPTALRGK
ncbi:hypothetical protein A5906_38590 [Bradyrhizobium sacchari]|nr:hypothetical protein A5906_38590 [Bradyrhizobium sacchari]